MRHIVVPIAFIAGCSIYKAGYVDKFTEADCEYLMACTSEPVLTFLGWASQEDCTADRGPEVAAEAAACDFDAKAGRACLKAVREQTCAADGDDREYPAICNDVFTLCTDANPDTSPDTDTGTEI